MNCHEVAGVEDSYLLGDLKGEEMREVERHLRTCLNCAKRLSGYEEVLGLMFSSLKPTIPAPHVRQAVLNRVAELPQAQVKEPIKIETRRKPFRVISGGFGRILSPVAAVLILGLTISTLFLGFQLQDSNKKQAEAQQVLDLAAAPDSWVWPLTQPDVPFDPTGPRARMYASPQSDIYLLTATQLKPPPDGQVYRAWYTLNQKVDYLGEVKPDQKGNAVLKVPNPDHAATGNITGCFITREAAGSPTTQPNGPRFLAWSKA